MTSSKTTSSKIALLFVTSFLLFEQHNTTPSAGNHAVSLSLRFVSMWKTASSSCGTAQRVMLERLVPKRFGHAVCLAPQMRGTTTRPSERGGQAMVIPLSSSSPQLPLGTNNRAMQKRWFESEADYHRIADDTLEGLQDQIEQVLEGLPQTPSEMDVSYASGVLTIALPPHGTWVLNKQTPNRQIWWSSPLSGPMRFEYDDATAGKDDGLWYATKNGLTLVPLLAQELSHVLKTEIVLELNA